ncbi:MAG: helix-turn-helix domain-containing protein [Chitinispirillia bacterium]|nr:helix-turn-helix domain-containing protein [Chitinispirillia bacterium]MCL2241329.1 helix-turn-helix domain-containing protein [Chitinispirillia bacterium]
MVEETYYTSKEIATMLKISMSTLVKHRHRIVGAERVGRLWRFSKEKVDARRRAGKKIWLES